VRVKPGRRDGLDAVPAASTSAPIAIGWGDPFASGFRDARKRLLTTPNLMVSVSQQDVRPFSTALRCRPACDCFLSRSCIVMSNLATLGEPWPECEVQMRSNGNVRLSDTGTCFPLDSDSATALRNSSGSVLATFVFWPTDLRTRSYCGSHSSPKLLPRNGVRELIAYFVDNFLPDLVFEEFSVRCRAKAP
jgi:hypothetical protein